MSRVIWARVPDRKLQTEKKISDLKFCIVLYPTEENNQLLDEETFKTKNTEEKKAENQPKQMDFSFYLVFVPLQSILF